MNMFFVALAYSPADSFEPLIAHEMIKAKDIDDAMEKMLKKWRKKKWITLGDCCAWEKDTMERMFSGKL